jgi:hypothetical protein
MSFGGNKKPINEIKTKEKLDDNLKNQITEKIFEIMTQNNLLKEKV